MQDPREPEGVGSPGNMNHRKVWAAIRVPGTTARSSERAASALNPQAISPAWECVFLSWEDKQQWSWQAASVGKGFLWGRYQNPLFLVASLGTRSICDPLLDSGPRNLPIHKTWSFPPTHGLLGCYQLSHHTGWGDLGLFIQVFWRNQKCTHSPFQQPWPWWWPVSLHCWIIFPTGRMQMGTHCVHLELMYCPEVFYSCG